MSKPKTDEPPFDLTDIAAALDSSEADIAVGRIVSGDELHRMLRTRIDGLEARMAKKASLRSSTVKT